VGSLVQRDQDSKTRQVLSFALEVQVQNIE
jgi:hypothetical protein